MGDSAALLRLLVGAAAEEALARAIPSLPFGYAHFGFEVRLAAGAGAVDIGLSVEPEAADFLERWSAVRNPRSRQERDALVGLSRLAAIWGRDATLWSGVPFIFLELDAATAFRIPNVFVAVSAPYVRARHVAGGAFLATRVLEALLPAGQDSWRAALDRALAGLPTGGVLLHVGAMLARMPTSVRLSVSIGLDGVGSYLDCLGISKVRSAIATLRRFRDVGLLGDSPASVQVDFDISPQLASGLGFTLRPAVDGTWADLLERLVAMRLAGKRKAATLAKWSGSEIQPAVGLRPSRMDRYISHVKLSWREGEPLTAKAYFGARSVILEPRRTTANGRLEG